MKIGKMHWFLVWGGWVLVLGFTNGIGMASEKSKADESSESGRAALAVEIIAVSRGDVSELVFADGNTMAARREYLLFESAGRVAFLKSHQDGGPLREGDSVKNGELLAELDRRIDNASARAARAELDTVRASLANAKTEYERAKRLKAGDAIQESRFLGIETEYKQALAEVRAAEARSDQVKAGLRQLQLRAPFDGVVAFVNIREGQYVSPEQFDGSSNRTAVRTSPIVVIDPSSFEIVVELPVVWGRRVRPGQTVYILDEGTLAHVQEFGFDPKQGANGFEDLLVRGRIGSVSPAIDPGSRSIRARVVTDEQVEGLTDGGYVTAWIETRRRKNAVRAPLESLVFRGEKAYAFVLDPETMRVERRTLTLGITGEQGVEILAGLKIDEWVVTKGRFRLTQGMRVRKAVSVEANP